jgi:hypothetical protein
MFSLGVLVSTFRCWVGKNETVRSKLEGRVVQ